MINNKKAGIYYFGFPTCDWCIALLPQFKNILKENDLKAYVVNTNDISFTKNIQENFQKIYRLYTQQNEVYVPFILHITDKGSVKYHIGTVKNHNAKLKAMTDEQIHRLKLELIKTINNSE